MVVIEVFPEQRGWSVRLKDEPPTAHFASRDQAERRARWIAVRHMVRDVDAEVRLLDRSGETTARWVAEGPVEAVAAKRRAA